MKTIQKNTPNILLVLLFPAFIFACADEKDTEQEVVKKKLMAKSWTIESATIDGVDKTTSFPDLSITFTSTGFTAQHGGEVWASSGTWQFADQKGSSIVRDDNVVVTLEEVTETHLVVSLQWTKQTLGPGRIASIKGLHRFNFN
jgi:hypothetical protein